MSTRAPFRSHVDIPQLLRCSAHSPLPSACPILSLSTCTFPLHVCAQPGWCAPCLRMEGIGSRWGLAHSGGGGEGGRGVPAPLAHTWGRRGEVLGDSPVGGGGAHRRLWLVRGRGWGGGGGTNPRGGQRGRAGAPCACVLCAWGRWGKWWG
jgi:hypothetical protein